jgi:hypothetical protein
MPISFQSILSRLVAVGRESAKSSHIETAVISPTSIRLKPSTRLFIEKQAEALSTSHQSVVNMILDGVAETTMDPVSSTLGTIRDRFFHVFEAHGLDLPNIVSVMSPQGIKLSDLANNNRLLDLLNRKMMSFITETFFLRSDWLSGSSEYPINNERIEVRWHDNLQAVAWRVLGYHEQGLEPNVIFVRRKGAKFELAREKGDGTDREDIGVIIKLTRRTNDGLAFSVYDSWAFERWNYWRCREQMKHLIAFCDKAVGLGLLKLSGIELNDEKIAALSQSRILPVEALARRSGFWFPEDYASVRVDVKFEADDWIVQRAEYEKRAISKVLEDYLKK